MNITSERDAQNRIVISDGINNIAFSESEIIDLYEFAKSNLQRLNREVDKQSNRLWAEFNSKVRRLSYESPLAAYNNGVRKVNDQITELQANAKAAGRIGRLEVEVCLTPLQELKVNDGKAKLTMSFAILATEHESIQTRRRNEKLQRRFELFGAVGLVGSR